jgi:benzoyl-CoA-dihydrodiol lyase
MFCTMTEGVRGQRAKDWRLVDEIAKPAQFAAKVRERADALASESDRPLYTKGIALTPLDRQICPDEIAYRYVNATLDRAQRVAHVTVRAPQGAVPESIEAIVEAGAAWWPLQMARELDDAILHLRANEQDLGTWLLHTRGDPHSVLLNDELMQRHNEHWFVRETIGMLRRTLARLDVSSRSLFALIERDSCFIGTLFELALSADRSYMLDTPEGTEHQVAIGVSSLNFGPLPMVNGLPRLAQRFYMNPAPISTVRSEVGRLLSAGQALRLGLVTLAPDELDWDSEIRIAIEERASLSPDALTGMEANLRFGGSETMETRIFGRLSAWQNWIFIRPNAVGERGALKVYGKGDAAAFNWQRV